jgi:anti-sigma regulatory factor (Ser/Thr protein kinase)
MPEAFGMGVETDESGSYPTPFGFSQVLARQAEKIGLSGGFGSSKERSLIEFLYETFRNSIEHGYHDPASFPRSTRAVIIEKLPAPDEQALPGGMSYEVGSYLRRMLSSSSHELGFGFVSISVVDQGFGIQNTMPRLDSEEDKDVFCRAFRRGESRKPNGFVKRGLGLDNALAAAMSIGAFVRIASGGLYCEIDYSKDENKYPGISKSLLKNIDCGWNGTVFSILMPDFSSDKDQGGLF